MRILSIYYKGIVSIGGKDTTLPWIDMTSHCHWCVGHPSFTSGKKSPFPLMGRAPHYHWWEGQLLVIGGRASHYHWWEGHSIAIWLVRHLIAMGGKGTPLPFGGKGIPLAFQEDTAGLSSGYSNDIIGMV